MDKQEIIRQEPTTLDHLRADQNLRQGLGQDQNPAVAYVASLESENSRRTMRRALERVAEVVTGDENATADAIPWHRLDFQHTQAIRAALAEQYAHTTANQSLSALRQVLKFAQRLGLMSAEQHARASDVQNVKGQRLPAGRYVATGERFALFGACGDSPKGARDAALLAVLFGAGVRRNEARDLDVADVTADGLRVQGKGNKERLVPLSQDVRAVLEEWIEHRGDRPGPLFLAIRKGGTIRYEDGRLSGRGINHIIKARAREAGVQEMSAHDFRRTFISELLDRGADISTVQRLVGHAKVETTQRYDRRGERVKQAAVDLLHIPRRRRDEEE